MVAHLGRLERERHPEVRRQTIGGPRRQYADDGIGPSIHTDVAADDGRIGGVARAPESIAEQNDLVLPGLIVSWLEVPSERNGLAKHPMPVGCDATRPHPERLVDGRQVEEPRRDRLQILERLRGFLPREIVARRHGAPVTLWRLRPHHHQLVRLGERQRRQQRGVHHAEDRRIRADAERQGGDGGDRKAARLHQPPYSKPQIGPQHAHRNTP